MNTETIFFGIGFYGLLVSIAVSMAAVLIKKVQSKKSGSSLHFLPVEKASLSLSLLVWLALTLFIAARAIRTGHGPFTSMYEFSVAFAWGILSMSIFFSWKYQSSVMNLLGLAACTGLLAYANTLSSQAQPLVPALQNSLLLTVHVFSAVVAYGAFTIGLIASILFLIQKDNRFASLPNSESLEKIGYHSVIIGFPFMTLVIVLGALWADIAWGRFWNWDPKETASLITWLIYAAYIHVRVMRGWRGVRSALLLIIGFAATLLTFFGNYIFSGIHAY